MRALLIAAGLALAAATALAVTKADSAEMYPMDDAPQYLVLKGVIKAGDGERFHEFYRAQVNGGVMPTALVLDSEGGDVAAGARIAALVRDFNLTTAIPSGSTCASMCTLVFAAGIKRFYSDHAHIGVHSVMSYSGELDGPGTEDDTALATTSQLAREMKSYGTPDGIIAKLVLTPGTDMAWLTWEDVEGWATCIPDATE